MTTRFLLLFAILAVTTLVPLKAATVEEQNSAENSLGICTNATVEYFSLNSSYSKIHKDAKISYILSNNGNKLLLVNKYCAIKPRVSSDNIDYILKCSGSDGYAKIKSSDIILLKPKEKTVLTVSVGFLYENGLLRLIRSDDSGTFWNTDPIKQTDSIELKASYENLLGEASLEKIAPLIKQEKYIVLPKTTLPSVCLKVK